MSLMDRLPSGQRTVVNLAMRHYTAKEIGAMLGLSTRTVETYKDRAAGALGMDRKSMLRALLDEHMQSVKRGKQPNGEA